MISIRTEAILSAARDAARIGAAGISGALYRAAALQTNREVRKTTRTLTSAWRCAVVESELAHEYWLKAPFNRGAFGHWATRVDACESSWQRILNANESLDTAALELKAWLTRAHSGRTIDRVLASVAA